MKKVIGGLIVLCILSLIYMGVSSTGITGADDRVQDAVKSYAQAAGIIERPPLINTDQGELLLFLFALGGAVSGFWIGYVWRGLFGGGNGR